MKRVIKNSSTRNRIADLEDQIDILESHIEKREYADEDELVDMQMRLDELKEQLNFAWQDDEAEWDYAREQQEFNPDGSLALYSSTKAVKAATDRSDARYAVDYCNALLEAGCDEHEIFQYFFDYLPSSKVIEVLKDYARVCDCEDEVAEIMGE